MYSHRLEKRTFSLSQKVDLVTKEVKLPLCNMICYHMYNNNCIERSIVISYTSKISQAIVLQFDNIQLFRIHQQCSHVMGGTIILGNKIFAVGHFLRKV